MSQRKIPAILKAVASLIPARSADWNSEPSITAPVVRRPRSSGSTRNSLRRLPSGARSARSVSVALSRRSNASNRPSSMRSRSSSPGAIRSMRRRRSGSARSAASSLGAKPSSRKIRSSVSPGTTVRVVSRMGAAVAAIGGAAAAGAAAVAASGGDGARPQAASDKAVRILQACDAGEWLPRVSADPEHFECAWCAWRQRCWA